MYLKIHKIFPVGHMQVILDSCGFFARYASNFIYESGHKDLFTPRTITVKITIIITTILKCPNQWEITFCLF